MKLKYGFLAACLFLSSHQSILLAQDVQPDYDAFDQLPGGISIEVQFPRQTQIEGYQLSIASDLKQVGLVQGGVKVGVGVGLLGICYALFNDYKIINVSQIKDMISPSVQYNAMQAELIKQFPEKSFAFLPCPNVEQTSGWATMIKNFAIFAGQTLALGKLQQAMAKLFHDNSVEWFCNQRTTLNEIYDEIAELKTDVEQLKNKAKYVGRYRANQYASSLIRLHNSMVVELESVIGYIRYKIDLMKLHGTHLYGDGMLGFYLYTRLYDVSEQLHRLKNDYANCTNNDERITAIIEMFDHIEQLSIELNSSLCGFKRLEKQLESI